MDNDELTFNCSDMSSEQVASTMAAYLMGHLSFDNKTAVGTTRHGPFKTEADGTRWQLDTMNNFWLHFEPDGRAKLIPRYDSGREVCKTMVQLFQLRYPPRRIRASA